MAKYYYNNEDSNNNVPDMVASISESGMEASTEHENNDHSKDAVSDMMDKYNNDMEMSMSTEHESNDNSKVSDNISGGDPKKIDLDAHISTHFDDIVINTECNDNDEMVADTDEDERWRRRRIVSLYILTITILYADLNLVAPNLSIIADEFGMTDDERDVKLGGLLALGFFLVGAPVSYIVGWLADSRNRSPLFAATVFVGELACLCTTFVKGYWQLYICRVMTGISIGGALPIVYSVLGDLFPANQRNAIAALVSTGTGLGMGMGQIIAGSVNSWRLPFVYVAIPGLICSVLLLFVNDPQRGAKEAAVMEAQRHEAHREVVPSTLSESDRRTATTVTNLASNKRLENCGMDCQGSTVAVSTVVVQQELNEIKSDRRRSPNIDEVPVVRSNRVCALCKSISCDDTCKLLKIPSVLLTILQAAPGALPFGFCVTFYNDFLQEQRGMTKAEATGVLATFGVGNAIGVILGGVLGHIAYKRDVRGPPFIMGISLLLGCIPFYFLTNYVDKDASTAAVAGVTIISGMLVVIPVPLERAILTNVCLPQLRGRANAFVSIVDDLGKGLGPALVSLLITSSDRQTAFNISLIGWIVGGLLSLAIMIFVAKDEESVQHELREQLAQTDLEWC